MKKSLSIIAVLALATACIYPFQPDLEEAPEGVLAVDGSIMIGEPSIVRVGSMFSLIPKKTDPSSAPGGYYYASSLEHGLEVQRVWAEDNAGVVYEGTYSPINFDGNYTMLPYSIPTEKAPNNRSYRVCIQANGDLYSSDWIKPLAPPVLRKITFKASKQTEKAEVTVAVTLDGGEDATGYVLLSFDETWKFHADWYPNYDYDPDSNTVSERLTVWDRYWCWKHVDSQTQVPVDITGMTGSTLKDYPLHSFSRYDNRNHDRYCIRVKARTIDKSTYLYLRHLEESTQSGDNLFTPNPGEISGNLRCETDPDRMVLGYVTVAIASSLRTFKNSQYLLTRPTDLYSLSYPDAVPQMPGQYSWIDYYQMGYLPLVSNTLPPSNPPLGPYGWGRSQCYDCIAAGGTQVKPDFWDE